MPGKAGGTPRIIALMNQKGGVGKTTTSVNLAAGLAEAGRSTLLIDLDPQAHATLHLGHEPGGGDQTPSVYDALLDPASAVRAAIESRPNLRVMRSETDLAAAESELAGPDRLTRLRSCIDRVVEAHPEIEFVLIDCPPSLGQLTLNALGAAREVLIPMQAHFLALQGVGKLLETVGLVREELNPGLSVAGVILGMHDAQSTHTREVVSDLEAFFDDARGTDVPWRFARVFSPPVRRNIKLAECPSFGQTVFEYAPLAAGAQDYRELAEALIADGDRVIAPVDDDALSEAEIRVLKGAAHAQRPA